MLVCVFILFHLFFIKLKWCSDILEIILSKFECFPVDFGFIHHQTVQYLGNDIMLLFMCRYYFDMKSTVLGIPGILTKRNICKKRANGRMAKMIRIAFALVVRITGTFGRIGGNKYIVCVWPVYARPMKSRDFLS